MLGHMFGDRRFFGLPLREKIFWSGECRISPAVPGAQGLMHARFTLASEEKIFR
ncbi:hypothetical protein BRADI_2g57735v3 [Brachypodium distachyon]|uniref:Uncharacterized protein n=1 Tax=Brachypodium distachyon TaxID=15368 RepID=A0A0Q3N2Z6_BRADI|nr:hypothetical protein BRADI_2g57735v3 [Brachypodium distachyon]